MTRLSSIELIELFRQLKVPIPASLPEFREMTAVWQQEEGKQLRLQVGPQHDLYMLRCEQFRSVEENFIAYQELLYAAFCDLAQTTLRGGRKHPFPVRDELRARATRDLRLSGELLDRFLSCLIREQGLEFVPTPPEPPPQSVPPRATPMPPRATPMPPHQSAPDGRAQPSRRPTQSDTPRRHRPTPIRRSSPNRSSFWSTAITVAAIYGLWRFLSAKDSEPAPTQTVLHSTLPKLDPPTAVNPRPVDCGCEYPGTSCRDGECRLSLGARWALSAFAITRKGTARDSLSANSYTACVRPSSIDPWSCAPGTTQGVARDASHLNYYFKPSRSVVITTEWLEQSGIDVSITEASERIAVRSAYAYRDQQRLLPGKRLFSGGLVVPLEHPYLEAVILHFGLATNTESVPPRPASQAWLGFVMSNPRANEPFSDAGVGVFIERVFSGSPAQRAGIEIGDSILSVGGQPVANSGDVQRQVHAHEVGKPLTIGVMRNGRAQFLVAVPAEGAAYE